MLKVKACYVTPIIQHEFVKCEYKHEKKYTSSKKTGKKLAYPVTIWPTPSKNPGYVLVGTFVVSAKTRVINAIKRIGYLSTYSPEPESEKHKI